RACRRAPRSPAGSPRAAGGRRRRPRATTPPGRRDGHVGRRRTAGGSAGTARRVRRACARPRFRARAPPGAGRETRPRRDAASSRPSRRPSRRGRAPVRGRADPSPSPTGGGTRSPEPRRPLPGPQWRRARESRTTSTASGRRLRASLDEEPPDHGFGLGIVALADVPVPDDPFAVHEDQCRPRSHAEPGPDREVVVLHDRVAHAEPLRRVDDLIVRLLPEELGAADADHGEPRRRVPFVPPPQLRDHIAAVDSAVRPELDEDHGATQALHRQGIRVDPRPPAPRATNARPHVVGDGRGAFVRSRIRPKTTGATAPAPKPRKERSARAAPRCAGLTASVSAVESTGESPRAVKPYTAPTAKITATGRPMSQPKASEHTALVAARPTSTIRRPSPSETRPIDP